MDQESIQSVSQITDSIKYALNLDFSDVWVAGEISGCSQPSSGHIYLTLKDTSAQLSTVIWRSTAEKLTTKLVDGMQVVCRGYIDVYPQRGTYQLIARQIYPVGQGALQQAFRKLYEKLKREGLFESDQKKPLPEFPKRAVVITSPTGAAVEDFLRVVKKRWPLIDLLVYPARVQGPDAAGEIARAIKKCNHNFSFQPEVIVVTRGGGSIEDLWPFNEEELVRSIASSRTPILCGIGHEIDVTLAELAADVRAQTPTEAGELLVPDVTEIRDQLDQLGASMRQICRSQVQRKKLTLDAIANRPAIRRPIDAIRQRSILLDSYELTISQSARNRFRNAKQKLNSDRKLLQVFLKNAIPKANDSLQRIAQTFSLDCLLGPNEARKQDASQLLLKINSHLVRVIRERRASLDQLSAQLEALSPNNVLNRGYSLTVDKQGNPIANCDAVGSGDTITTWLAAGKISSQVESTNSNSKLFENGQEEN